MHNVNIGGMFCSIVGYLLLVARKEIPNFCLYSYSVFVAAYSKSKFCLTTRHFLMLTCTCMDASALSSGSVGFL